MPCPATSLSALVLSGKLLTAGLVLALALALAALVLAAERLPGGRRPWLDAAAVFALALAVRLVYLRFHPGPAPAGDSWEYLMRARRLATGRVDFWTSTRWHAWQTWIRPPGYFAFLAALHGGLFQAGISGVVTAQAWLSAVAAGATTLLARPLFGRGAALAAGVLFALSLESVLTVPRILSEPLYMVFLVPALAALAWLSRRPRPGLAALAGALFGLAALVRSAPLFYVPAAAALLLVVHGWGRGWRVAAALVGGLVVVVAPWCVRNSILYGYPMGIDDMSVVNVLQVSPDDRWVRASDVDLDGPHGWRTYYDRLQRANRGGRLTRRGGRIVLDGIGHLLSHPGRALGRFGTNLQVYFAGFGPGWIANLLPAGASPGEGLTVGALANAEHLLVLIAGALGVLLYGRRRETWPLLLWFLFNLAVINLLFHPEEKYRFPTWPVAMAFAGAGLAWIAGALARRPTDEDPAAEEPS